MAKVADRDHCLNSNLLQDFEDTPKRKHIFLAFQVAFRVVFLDSKMDLKMDSKIDPPKKRKQPIDACTESAFFSSS